MRPRRPCIAVIVAGAAGLAAHAARAAPAGSVGCLLENGALVVPAILDNAGGDWLIDFAAPQTLLHETRAQKEGIAEPSTVGDLRFAGLALPATPVTVANLDPRSPGFVTPIVGVIGDDVLGRYVVDIDFAPCTVTFYAPGKAPRFAGQRLPLAWIDGRPTVRAAVSDGRRALAGAFVVDTASKAAVRLSIPMAHGPDDGDPRQWSPTWIRALSIGGALFEKPSAARGAELPATVAGALGTDWLRRYRLRIDLPGGGLTLAKPRP